MFEVEIKNLKTKAKIGISSKERTKFQTLIISCRFKYSIIKKEKIDDIKYLKDYSSIVKFLKEFVQKSKYKSIERLTFECANILEKKYTRGASILHQPCICCPKDSKKHFHN